MTAALPLRFAAGPVAGLVAGLAAGLVGVLAPGLAAAQPVPLPDGAVQVTEEVADPGTMAIATGPWTEAGLPVRRVTGPTRRSVWRIDAAGLTTAGILAPIEASLGSLGYETLLVCETEGCGGFDFRFALEVTDPPAMHVDLADFRYLAAEAPDGGVIAVLVSRSAQAGFVEIASGGRAAAPSAATPSGAAPAAAAAPAPADLAAALDAAGHAILDGLTFETGSSRLGPGGEAALEALAAWLAANPGVRVALVGHTDAEGGLQGNVALSRQRAASVLERLVAEHDVPRDRVEAQGMGWLAPVASNLTAAGRERNRRVEAVVLATE